MQPKVFAATRPDRNDKLQYCRLTVCRPIQHAFVTSSMLPAVYMRHRRLTITAARIASGVQL